MWIPLPINSMKFIGKLPQMRINFRRKSSSTLSRQ
ncbi:MAG: hypothetical protein KBI30_04325 [Candidatus Atribacteria bacterium]|nr:hypothetical protein [Candidatus Atribacteria bacterium]